MTPHLRVSEINYKSCLRNNHANICLLRHFRAHRCRTLTTTAKWTATCVGKRSQSSSSDTTINLMMTLSGGTLAFFVNEKLEGKLSAPGWAGRFALGYLGLSVLAAIGANVTRGARFSLHPARSERTNERRSKSSGPPRYSRSFRRLDLGSVLFPSCNARTRRCFSGVVGWGHS
jgi:hypothetical protein